MTLYLGIFIVFLLIVGSIIPIRLAIAKKQQPSPQAVLILGGAKRRIKLATKFLKANPDLQIWVSDYYRKLSINQEVLADAGIVGDRVHYDTCATDTVTNFTCTVDDFTQRNIRHIYILTSDYHISRAETIAFFILGSRGIAFTPITVVTREPHEESIVKNVRDSVRALLWIFTGKTGASFNQKLKESD